MLIYLFVALILIGIAFVLKIMASQKQRYLFFIIFNRFIPAERFVSSKLFFGFIFRGFMIGYLEFALSSSVNIYYVKPSDNVADVLEHQWGLTQSHISVCIRGSLNHSPNLSVVAPPR